MIENLYDYLVMLVSELSRYSGRTIVPLIYIFNIYHLYIHRENKIYKYLSYFSIIYFVLAFNPLSYVVIYKVIDQETFYRYFWPFNFQFTIVLTLLNVFRNINKQSIKILLTAAFIVTTIVIGQPVFQGNKSTLPENIYKIPNQFIEISQLLHSAGLDEIKIVAPSDVCEYIRQYDPSIKVQMVYSNNSEKPGVLVDQNSIDYEYLYQAMLSGKSNVLILKGEHKKFDVDKHYNRLVSIIEYNVYTIKPEVK